MAKYRSSLDYKQQYEAVKNGYAVSIENYAFLKKETVPGTFIAMNPGVRGSSVSGSTPSTDISGGTDTSIKISVDGGTAVTATVTPAGLTSGALIAAALETAINTALGTAGQDGRVEVTYTTTYNVFSQKVGTHSTIVITAADSNNLTEELKLGVTDGGTEVAGSGSPDWLWFTKFAIKHAQDFEASKHRSGRQPASIIKKKKMCDGDVEMYVNMATGGTPTVDNAVDALLACIFGTRVDTGSEIKYTQAQAPTAYFSVLQCNNSFNRIANGAYAKNWTLTLPGDGEASMKFTLKARETKEASVAKVTTGTTSATHTVGTGEGENFEDGSIVMIVGADGRTVSAGADGSLTVSSASGTSVTLSGSVTTETNGYIVPWSPYTFGFGGTDNPVTGLQGQVSFDGGSTFIEEIRSVEVSVDPKAEDLDGYYGYDTNRGYIIGDRNEISVKVEMNMSASQFKKVLAVRNFDTFSIKAILGPSGGRRLELVCPKVQFKVPAIDIPDAGSIPVTFEGTALQSYAGALDAITLSFK